MRSLWVFTAAIGAAIMILTHASVVGILIGIAFLGLSGLLLFRSVGRAPALHG